MIYTGVGEFPFFGDDVFIEAEETTWVVDGEGKITLTGVLSDNLVKGPLFLLLPEYGHTVAIPLEFMYNGNQVEIDIVD